MDCCTDLGLFEDTNERIQPEPDRPILSGAVMVLEKLEEQIVLV